MSRRRKVGKLPKPDADFLRGLGRAGGGALVFSLPLLMTMEMWRLGFSANPLRLGVFLLLFYPFLVLLSRYVGFERTYGWLDDAVDAFVAYGVGFAVSLAVLLLLGILGFDDSTRSMMGKVSLQAVPASIGALLSRSQFGDSGDPRKASGPDPSGKTESGSSHPARHYLGEVFIMSAGSLYLALNVAPTQEMAILAFKMGPFRGLALMAATLAVMHAFTYQSGWQGEPGKGKGHGLLFLRYTVIGYAQGILLGLYVLWTFGRTEGVPLFGIIMLGAVIGFPAGIGAAAGRILL